MTASHEQTLSRRERQIMDVIFQKGQATVSDVLAALPEPPSYSAVRATLGILEEKGLLRHHKDGRRFVYSATIPRRKALRSALRHMLNTFFDGSTEGAMAALLEMKSADLSADALARIKKLIEETEKEGR
jgi:BlaI family transcriptional regulator, penicillinase repressor